MELTWEQIRLLLMHEWGVGENAGEAARKTTNAWGDDTVAERTARKWFAKFKSGEDSLEDQPHSGRPQEIDRQAVLGAIKETPSLTTRMLADGFDCSPQTIDNISHEPGKIWKKTRWIPHKLTDAQKRKQVNCA